MTLSSNGLEGQSLTSGYNDTMILNDVNICLQEGKVTAFIGPNGCGKSTLMKTLTGAIKAKKGDVTFKGKALNQWKLKDLAKHIAILPQHPTAPEGVLVEQLVALGRVAHRKWYQGNSERDQEVITESLASVGLAGYEKRVVSTLSGGERQRVWLAMCLAQEAQWLLLDEPTSYLDLGHQLELLEVLYKLNKERNLTIVYVLHELSQAAQFCDELVLMKKGQILKQGSPLDVLTESTLESVFKVEGKMEVIDGYVYCLPKAYVREEAR
ncbi:MULTISPECIES: ABC transporter ATP-binding protein [Vibrio]|uniref:ABC transporter ATP-binding protein n=1 Tax=Vibrio TaxID=662 RepID=UPI001BD5B5B5|nr:MULTISPECIES: ABC transporter ATP-binding protein [Vibrio]ELA9457749.1 ABC transporter ATP-binding protein [Vibrio alginolyticus]MBS9845711.1 ABC transporter ATP-binding protein [Vibrio alginolyticus]MBS9937093.1 ABC transporter ATP-binding protein [Vibrio alginolyticus]MCG9740813.1 ABC transporter ATP-binding protein [Vibrio alginolyticus]MDW1633488.1 ABC transporter ATP-binding protein [Vibrio sp. Vb2907]